MKATPESVIGMTVEQLIETSGGLSGVCKLFGWQGGTVHQAKEEALKRLAYHGIYPHKETGVLVQMVFGRELVERKLAAM